MRLQPNLNFQMKKTEAAMEMILEETRSSWPHDLAKKHESVWVKTFSDRLRRVCSHVQRAIRQGDDWIEPALHHEEDAFQYRSPSDELEEHGGIELADRDAVDPEEMDDDWGEESEEEGDAVEEAAPPPGGDAVQKAAPPPGKNVDGYAYGYDPAKEMAWRMPAGKHKQKELV